MGLSRPLLAAVTTIAAVASVGAAPSSAAAGAADPAPTGTIEVVVDGPPGVAEVVTIELTSGADVIDVSTCADVTEPSDGRRAVRCADLADGTYSLELTDVPTGSIVDWDCTDIVATQAEPSALRLDDGFTQWFCLATVAPPSILLSAGAGDPFDPVLLAADGSEVPCVNGDLPFEQRRWCTTPVGEYTIDPDSIDPVFAAPDVISCLVAASGAGVDRTPIIVDASTTVVRCDFPAIGNLSADITWNGLETETAPWFDSLSAEVRDADGAVVDVACEMLEPGNSPGFRRIVFACDVGAGVFDVRIVGIPADQLLVGGQVGTGVDVFEVLDTGEDFVPMPADGRCGAFEVAPALQGICILSLGSPGFVEQTAEPDPAEGPEPVTELPATGPYSDVIGLIGLLFVAAGWALVSGVRRPAVSERRRM